MIEESVRFGDFLCRVIRSANEGENPVVFLHGYAFNSEVWKEINVLKALEEKGIPFIAIDMPYGSKSRCQPKTDDVEKNVEVVEMAVGDREPIIVGASLGGYIALRYAVRKKVRGLLLVAPVRGLEEDLMKEYDKLKGKVWIIYGENDEVVPKWEMKDLAKALDAELIVYENAGHPAYLDRPERFKEDLLKFCSEL